MLSWPDGGREAKAGSRWWWLGSAVERDNLRWQMEQLANAGIGTLEITPIYGVKGNDSRNLMFLSPEWLAMLDYTQQLGDEMGIDIDMTTGTGWPSGGPMVKLTESASRLVTETLTLTGDGVTEISARLTNQSGELQRVVAFPQGDTAGEPTDVTPLVSGKTLKWTAPQGEWRVIAVFNQYGVMQVKRPAPGSAGYVVDYFDSTAVANYLKYFDQRFAAANGRWPHSFFNDSYEINQADWTPRLFDEFERRRGYKLEYKLDKLLDRDPQVYADYRLTLSDMLQENFTRQWTRWAHGHGVITRNQAHGSPGNIIDLYAEADIPETENFYLNSFGIKGLRDDKGFYLPALSSKATLKYASSAAHIAGKKLTSSESMTWLTEHFRTSLSQMKPELDMLFAAGVNHVLFHGTAYSPREAAWPGWKFYASMDLSPTNSIWRDVPSMTKYIERVQTFMQAGQPDNDVLVYAPFAYAMHKTTGEFQPMMALFNINTLPQKMPEVEQCVATLGAMGLDCDYTSEHFLMGTAFNDGQLQTAAGTRYKALVVPVTEYMPDSVARHIEALRQQGAVVVEGYKDDALSALTLPGEQMRQDMSLSVIRRSNDHGHHYFIANLTPDDVEGYAALAVDFKDAAFFDPMTGNISKAAMSEGKVWVSLKSGQSVLLQTYDAPLTEAQAAVPTAELGALPVEGQWSLDFYGEGLSYELPSLQSWETIDDKTAVLMGTGTYATTFSVTPGQMATATAGFRLDLGDVRESAHVWLNDMYLGCVWAAPFTIDCGDAVREGVNTLRIEVTNLPANRISDMDRRGVVWRIFEDINMSNISTDSYAAWQPVPSGLNSDVRLVPVATRATAMTLHFERLVTNGDGVYYPQYRLTLPTGGTIASLTATTAAGSAFTDFETQAGADGTMLLTLKGVASGQLIVTAADTEGTEHYAYVAARGGYSLLQAYDFTSEATLTDQWDLMKAAAELKGFEGSGKLTWYRSKKSLTVNADIFDGLTMSSDKTTYYSVFPSYGLNAFNDFRMTVDNTAKGDLLQVAYLTGEGGSVYNAADSLTTYVTHEGGADGLSVQLLGRGNNTVYRSALIFRPIYDASYIKDVATQHREAPPTRYNLQGQRVDGKRKGIYIENGRKVVAH